MVSTVLTCLSSILVLHSCDLMNYHLPNEINTSTDAWSFAFFDFRYRGRGGAHPKCLPAAPRLLAAKPALVRPSQQRSWTWIGTLSWCCRTLTRGWRWWWGTWRPRRRLCASLSTACSWSASSSCPPVPRLSRWMSIWKRCVLVDTG